MLGLKVIFRKSDGRLLGAQALGEDGPAVDKRISALAVAMQMGATIYDLEEAELCYAPQFGSAKDPVNFAGMVAADVLRGDMPLAHWDDTGGAFLLDVREPVELAVENVPGAVNIPLGQLRARLGELPARPRDPRHVPLRSACLLRDAHSAAERVQGPQHLRRHAVACDGRGPGGAGPRGRVNAATGQERRPMRTQPPSCVLLADRHHGLTEGVRGLLESAFGTVVMVADEASLLEGASRLQPDVVIVDLSLARDNGLDWLRAVRERCPTLKVIVLSVHDERSVRAAAMDAGADAFVLKRSIATDLLPAVALVRAAGGASNEHITPASR